jgi:hypothetical protein
MPQGFGTNWSTKNESRQNHLTTLVDKKFDTIRLTKKLDKDVFEKVWFRYLSEIRRKCSTKIFVEHLVGQTNPYFLFDSFVLRSVEDPWMTFFHSFFMYKNANPFEFRWIDYRAVRHRISDFGWTWKKINDCLRSGVLNL